LRQAYDYWQNQPGNYPEPGTTSINESYPGINPYEEAEIVY